MFSYIFLVDFKELIPYNWLADMVQTLSPVLCIKITHIS